jgi:hypothetical protein
MKTLPKYRVIQIDRKHEYHEEFKTWLNSESWCDRSCVSWMAYWYTWWTQNNWFKCYKSNQELDNDIELITIEQRHEAVFNTKSKRTKHTYETTHTRSDGFSFRKDSIGNEWFKRESIEELEQKVKELRAKANKIQWLLKSHKKLFPTQ